MKYANLTLTQVATGGQIRISFDTGDGSWSYIGMNAKIVDAAKSTMNLSRIDPDTETTSPRENGLILHEFGHMLGMLHEHRSPARGSKLTLNDESESPHVCCIQLD